jgi:hypothetical protein
MSSAALPSICTTTFSEDEKAPHWRFRVKIEPQQISVGGKRFCITIALREDDTYLTWLSTDEGGCELDEKVIRGEDTIRMVDLAFSLVRLTHPSRSIVTLVDDSGVSWKGPRQRTYKVNLLKGYLLLHRRTWYEEKFGATMEDDALYQIYRQKADQNFDDPTKKRESFSFGSASDELTPLYQASHTWGEFIDIFKATYAKRKYELMVDWYRKAIYDIFDGLEINQNWKIDIRQRPMYHCRQEGGRRTRKRSQRFPEYLPMPPFTPY